MWRIVTFFANILTILLVTISVYAALHYRPEVLAKYLPITRNADSGPLKRQ
ncbi:MAG: hypothetical protein R6X18_18445 [Chloroflexota bacterium]|jgi:hypothetical protein